MLGLKLNHVSKMDLDSKGPWSTSIRHRSDSKVTVVSNQRQYDVYRIPKQYLTDDRVRLCSHARRLPASRGNSILAWWRHQIETFSALLAICAGNSPVPGEFPSQRPVTRSFDVFFDLRLNKRLRKQSWGWWFDTLLCPLWRHCNEEQELPWRKQIRPRPSGFELN